MKKEWSIISLVFLVFVALMGTLIRSVFFIPLPFLYEHIIHAHSHVAFQGWVYTVMFLLLSDTYINQDIIYKRQYPLQFKLTVLVVLGILISFSLQGYGLYSITFSTIFQILNYWFIYRFFKDSKEYESEKGNTISLRFVKTGLIFGILSTVLPFAIGILSAKGMKGTQIYQSFVYTFLHLQYNGWFLFVTMGLFFDFLDKNSVTYKQKHSHTFYRILSATVLPACTLSFLGMDYAYYIEPIAYCVALFLGISLVYFILAIPQSLIITLKSKNYWFAIFFSAYLVSFVLKMIVQSISVLPIFITYAFYNKSIIIAYIYISLIGCISMSLFALMLERKWVIPNVLFSIGSTLLLTGFVSTELLLVFHGFGMISGNQIALVIGSFSMLLGITFIVSSKIIGKQYERQ